MKKIRRRIFSLIKTRYRKIRSRFFFAMIILALPSLFLLGYISYNIATNTLVKNSMQVNADHLKTSSEVADLLFEDMSNVQRLILSNDTLRKDLIESAKRKYHVNRFMGVQTLSALQKVVVTNLIQTKYIDSICLFDNNLRYVCYGSPTYPYISWTSSSDDQVKDKLWYKTIEEERGMESFFSYNILTETVRSDSFSSAKLLRDPANVHTDPIGFLIINIDQSVFENVFAQSDDSSIFLVVDSSANQLNTVYSSSPSVLAELVNGENSLQALIKELEDEQYLVSQYNNKTTDWTFLHIIPNEEVLKDSEQIGGITTIIATLIALVALILSYLLSDSITKPLKKLKKMMINWARGSDNFEEEFSDDEIGDIGNTFKQMAYQNKDLSKRLFESKLKEREAELKVLQAQIKPHFLYNTLNSIYLMAVMEGHEDIAKIADSLSENFKLSLNNGNETIPLKQEMEHINHYIVIQNIRYNNRFNYIESVDQELLEKEVLKLLLQPIVENAIYHGLEPKQGPGTIHITGKVVNEMVIFIIEDNGIGIKDISDTEKGYGIGNVRDRLFLYYGKKSSFDIGSQPGKGTKVTIQFPLNGLKEK